MYSVYGYFRSIPYVCTALDVYVTPKGAMYGNPPLPPTQTYKECFLTTTHLFNYLRDVHKNVKVISFPFVTSCGRVAARRGVYDVEDGWIPTRQFSMDKMRSEWPFDTQFICTTLNGHHQNVYPWVICSW